MADPDVPFVRYALAAGLLASVAFGVMGTYVVTRRISYIAAAISHCVLGGIGAALYLQTVAGWTWCRPLYGAVAAALTAAITVGLVSLYARQREDTVIGAIWVIGMAVGLLLLAKVPGYVDPMSYLFGNILLISRHDLWLIIVLDVLVVGVAVLLHNRFLAICFDEEFAELRGVPVKLLYLLLLCLTALTVVLLVSVVGIVMVIALLTLPAAIAGHFARRLWQMMVLATVCCAAFVATGLGVSYSTDLPSGSVIVVLAGVVYLLVAVGARLRRPYSV
ncbi:MAG: metal ABC transporter permease [Candidatus Nealsonbacteria bacterium]|nr:metal ABC transporter permease [Candidatus Nealsonbacteria bacterium]